MKSLKFLADFDLLQSLVKQLNLIVGQPSISRTVALDTYCNRTYDAGLRGGWGGTWGELHLAGGVPIIKVHGSGRGDRLRIGATSPPVILVLLDS